MANKNEAVGTLSRIKKKATRAELRGLIESQEYRCNLSGLILEPPDAALDHIVPVCNGGGHTIDNLQVVHVIINRMKGKMSNEDFIEMCNLVAKSNPRA